MPNHLDASALIKIALRAESLAPGPCNCTRTPLDGWNSQPVSLDEQRLEEICTLVVEDDPEPSYQEHLPGKLIIGLARRPSHRGFSPITAAACGNARNAAGSIFDTRKAEVTLSTVESAR